MNAAIGFPVSTTQAGVAERWGVRLLSLGVWALAAGSAVWWGLASPSSRSSPLPAAVVGSTVQTDAAQMARLLGQAEPASPASPALQKPSLEGHVILQGVVAEGDGAGVALLAVDGQQGKPFRTGQMVANDWWLQSVTRRSATLAERHGKQTQVVQIVSAASAPARTSTQAPLAYGAAAAAGVPAGVQSGAALSVPMSDAVASSMPPAALPSQQAIPMVNPSAVPISSITKPQEPPTRPD